MPAAASAGGGCARTSRRRAGDAVLAHGRGLPTAVSYTHLDVYKRQVQSYHSAQIFEAVGFTPEFVNAYFAGTVSRVGGMGVEDVEREQNERYDAALAILKSPAPDQLPTLGPVSYTHLTFIFEKLGVLGGYILSAGFLPLVSVGLHQALTPIHAMLNDPDGATKGINYLLPILMMAGGGQVLSLIHI